MKKKKFNQEEEEKKVAKVEKKLRVQVDMEDVSTKASSLIEILSKIDNVSELTDLKVSEALTESKKWENKIEVITASKVKIDKDCIGLDLDQKSKDNLADLVKKAKTAVDTKVTELKDVDSTRALFSLSKSVKEMAPYPKAFEGKKGEDVYKFKQKFMEALAVNQVSEKQKIEVLKKHLRGIAFENTGDHYATFDLAIKALVDKFGKPELTWGKMVEDFVKRCDNAKLWKQGSYDGVTVTSLIIEFLNMADKLAKDHVELESYIYGPETWKKVMKVLPPEIQVTIVKKSSGSKVPKVKLQEIRTFMEKENRIASDLVEISEELSHAQANFGSVNAFEHEKKAKGHDDKRYDDRKTDSHDCTKSSYCLTVWGLLGCVNLYKLATAFERKKLLRFKFSCYKCG